MKPEHFAEVRYHVADGYQPTVADARALIERIDNLEAALFPFSLVLLGEHRPDDENVWHSLKAHHFRDARTVLKGESIL